MNAPVELPSLAKPEQPFEALFAGLEKGASSFDLFQAMRRIECAFPDKPRLGDAMRPVEEPFRFAQEASLVFAPAPIAAFERSDITAVPAAGVIGEAMLAIVLANSMREKFGGDSIEVTSRNLKSYLEQLRSYPLL